MDKATLNNKEQKRLMVFNEVLAGQIMGVQAAAALILSAMLHLFKAFRDVLKCITGRQFG